jgi:hypothetical protein
MGADCFRPRHSSPKACRQKRMEISTWVSTPQYILFLCDLPSVCSVMCVLLCLCVSVCVRVCVCCSVWVSVYVCVCVCMLLCVCVCVCVALCVCVCMFVCVCACACYSGYLCVYVCECIHVSSKYFFPFSHFLWLSQSLTMVKSPNCTWEEKMFDKYLAFCFETLFFLEVGCLGWWWCGGRFRQFSNIKDSQHRG